MSDAALRQLAQKVVALERRLKRLEVQRPAWQNWTPAVNQGGSTSVSVTIDRAKYCVLGKTVFIVADLTVTSTGTAAYIEVTGLPVVPAYGSFQMAIGSFAIRDDSAPNNYAGAVIMPNTSVLRFRVNNSTGNGLGQNPALTLAADDTIGFTASYEKA